MSRSSGTYRQKWWNLSLLLTLLAQGAVAQTNSASAKALTFEDVLHYALEHYPAVRASLEQAKAAHAGVALARTQYLPQLSGAYQDSRATQNQVPGIWLPTPVTPTVEGPIGESSGQSYWASQVAALFSFEPVDFGLRAARVNGARSAEDKAQAELSVVRLQVAAAAGSYFLLALANQQAVVAAQANVDRWQVVDKTVRVLADNQLRPGADASRADAELARAKTQLYQTQQAERAARATLAALMGAAGSDIQLDGSTLLQRQERALPDLSAAEHPVVRAGTAAIRQAQAGEKILQRTDYPRLFLQAEGLGRGSEVPNNGTIIGNANGLLPARGNWIAGVTVLFPDVFGFKGLSVEKQIARADERAQEARREQAIQDLTGQIQAAREQWKTAQLVVQETPVELAAARLSETQSRARYEAGLATLVEVAEAENLLGQAEMDDALARLNVWKGLFSIAYAQGNLEDFLQILRDTNTRDH